MQKVYSVLAGTLLLDYENEEESKTNLNPKLVCEVLGISEWDGVGRAHQYSHGFIIVTHTGETYYLNALTAADRDEWILYVKRALECNFANPEIVPFKPSKIIQSRPSLKGNILCPVSKQMLSSPSTYVCRACGRGFISSDHIHEPSTMLQIGLESCERVCIDCKNAQMIILWLKIMNYSHVMALHEFTPAVSTDITRFKSSFKIRRHVSQRLDMAAMLFEKFSITADEFEELRRVDHEYRREQDFQESRSLKEALDAIGEDMKMIISLLMSPSASDRGGRQSYCQIIMKILEIADNHPELIDFYWSQLIQVHILLNIDMRNAVNLMKIDILQQALLAIAVKYPPLGLKLAWALIAVTTDYAEKKVTQIQYAACTCLLFQLEMLTTGFVSAIADVPSCKMLHGIIHASENQQQDIGYELGILFLIRRRLQEVYDEQELERRKRNKKKGMLYANRSSENVGGGVGSNVHASNSTVSSSAYRSKQQQEGDMGDENTNTVLMDDEGTSISGGFSSFSKDENSCIHIFHHMGVGRRNNNKKKFTSKLSETDLNNHNNSDDEEDDKPKPNDNSSTRKEDPSDLFSEQLDFMEELTSLAEKLRFIDRPLRTDYLKKELTKMNTLRSSSFGWDPTVSAGEPFYRIKRIVVEECRVFRTKARAPSMIVCEVVRDDANSSYIKYDEFEDPNDSTHVHVRDGTHVQANNYSTTGPPRKKSKDVVNIDEVDGLVQSEISHVIENIHNIRLSSSEARRNEQTMNNPPLSPSSSPSSSRSLNNSSSITHSNSTGNIPNLSNNQRSAYCNTNYNQPNEISSISPSSSNNTSHSMKSLPSSNRRPSQIISSNRKSVAFFNTLESFSAEDIKSMDNSNSSNNNNSDDNNTNDQKPVETNDSFDIVEVPLIPTHANGIHECTSTVGNSTSTPPIPSTTTQPSVNTTQQPIVMTAFVKKKVLQSAQSLLTAGKIAEDEFNTLILSDSRFRDLSAQDQAITTMIRVENAFGESWQSKKSRILGGRRFITRWSEMPYLYREAFKGTLPLPLQYAVSDNGSGNGYGDDNDRDDLALSMFNISEVNVIGTVNNSSPEKSSILKYLMEDNIDPPPSRATPVNTNNIQDEEEQEEGNKKSSVNVAIPIVPIDLTGGSIDMDDECDDDDDDDDDIDDNDEITSVYSSHNPGQGHNSNTSNSYPTQYPLFDLRCFIVKSNDDLRQEICCLRIMSLCKEIFANVGLERNLWLKPYRIISTGCSTGIVEVLPDSMSIDALKKTPGFTTLSNYFKVTYGSSTESLTQAKRNFATSLAAYSLFCYILSIKDRHNGNILIDTDGHIAHIDFGFILSIAPGGAFSLESAPFKLTEEMVDVLEGLESPLFGLFVKSFTLGFLALRAHAEIIISDVQLVSSQSPFPCFHGKDTNAIIEKLRGKFRSDLCIRDFVKHCMDLIVGSYGAYGTKQYDSFQWYTNGIST